MGIKSSSDMRPEVRQKKFDKQLGGFSYPAKIAWREGVHKCGYKKTLYIKEHIISGNFWKLAGHQI